MNAFAHDDAIHLACHAQNAQLAYLDPPFAVGVDFGARLEKNQVRARAQKGSGPFAYTDRWPSIDAYLAWLSPCVVAARDALSSQGTLWLHLDYRVVHEAKILLDSLFGRAHYLGEVVWLPGNGNKARSGPGITHQTLLIYAKGKDFIWNSHDPALREPYARTSLSMHFQQSDAEGRRFRERVVRGKTYRYYADEGRARGSVWDDCPAMLANTPLRRETTGYPTQKPEKLLDRIVRASSNPGGLVVDPFSGSGTTLVAAAKADRHFVGLDIGTLSRSMVAKRLEANGIAFSERDPCPCARATPMLRAATHLA